MRLSRRILLNFVIIVALLGGGSVWIVSSFIKSHLQQSQQEWVETLGHAISEGISRAVINNEVLHARNTIIEIVRQDKAIEYMYIVGFDGELFAHSFDNGIPRFFVERINQVNNNPTYLNIMGISIQDIEYPLIPGMKAALHIGINQSEINNVINKMQFNLMAGALVIFVLAVFVSMLLSNYITKPLEGILASIRTFGESGKAELINQEKINTHELKELSHAFNNMVSERYRVNEELEKHRDNLEVLVRERTQELEDMRDKALEASKAKSEFLAKMSHELRTPLNSIIGFTGILRDGIAGPVSDEQEKQLGMVYDSANHLLGLINDILDISKVEAGKMELQFESFDLQEALQEVKNVVKPLVDKPGKENIELIFDIDCTSKNLYSDKGKIRQVLLNLLSNAIKFTEKGAITLKCWQDTNILHFVVEDTGIGIPKEKQVGIFESFQQVDNSEVRSYEGTGLGLTITKQFVELMGGEISLDSEEGVGSKFELHIPITVVPLKPTAQIHTVFPDKKASVARISKEDCHVLVVDDDENALQLMKNYLEHEGYPVTTLSDSRLAVDKVKEINPMATILDVQMPDIDGWATLAALKSDNQTSSVPVIMVSVLDKKNLGLSLGAIDFLQKPVEPQQLSLLLNSLRIGNKDVLIVEDRKPDAEMLEIMLNQEGYHVRHAVDGIQALEFIVHSPPDLILLDLMMPQMSGFEVIQRLRANSETENIPIIVVSAKHLTEAEAEYLAENVEKVLVKGEMTRNDMLNEVGRVLIHICNKQFGDISS